MSSHVFGHGCLTQSDSHLQQFPMNAGSVPERIGEAHLPDQICELSEIQPGGHGNADFSNSKRAESSYDATR